MQPPRPRITIPRLLAAGAALAVLALLVFRAVATRDRSERYRIASDRYGEYARNYKASAERQNQFLTSCYGSRWDEFSKKVYKDMDGHRGDKAYLEEKAAHYGRLARDYEQAGAGVRVAVDPDPPPP